MIEAREVLSSLCESIEAEMRRLDIWANEPPGAAALQSQAPFCHDTLGFAEWMQWIFLPRVNEVLGGRRQMPQHSNIHAYAEEVLRNSGHDAQQLLFLIRSFDEVVVTLARTREQ